MKIVCAWCGKEMGERDGEGVEGITHSVCSECSAKIEAQEEVDYMAKIKECSPVTEVCC
jgi:DNA-directed RNA polymerase subunit RPC12/RpoP